MKELNLTEDTILVDFTINALGEAFISQTETAKLCGVGQDTISKYISRSGHTLKLNNLNQLSSNSLELVIAYYAFDSQRTNKTAMENYRILAKAGAKGYIYHLAGYELKALKPMTGIEMAQLQLQLQIELQASKDEVVRLEIVVDENTQWASIKKMEFKHMKKFPWKPLKDWHIKNSVEIPKLPDQNYPLGVNSYCAEAWMEIYSVEIT